MTSYISEAKFQDLVAFRIRELQNLYANAVTSLEFQAENTSPQYFMIPSEFTFVRILDPENPVANQNKIPVKFTPVAPGEYPCRVIVRSKFDVRLFSFKAIAIPATKRLAAEMMTTSGMSVSQEIPFVISSNDTWNFRVTHPPLDCFQVPQRFAIPPRTTYLFVITFNPGEVGTCTTEMTIMNINKRGCLSL
jgi:hypothetical protein